MKVAFLYGKFSLGQRPFDFDNIYTAPRGLTGSELSCLEYAFAMKLRGHDVLLVVGQDIEPREWRGVKVVGLKDPNVVNGCDAVCSWNEPDILREIAHGPFRLVNQQLNDFAYCRPGWEEFVDVVTSPSGHHLEFLKKQAPAVHAWDVLPNGCDPAQYGEGERVPGRVIWASSADRGLHRLLEAWPAIKARVPHASLRCFYNFQPAHFDDYEQVGLDNGNVHPDLLEIAQRKRYIQYATARLSDPKWDVQHVGSVSRERIRQEFEQAEVLGYPCDTIRYTEGFSVTTMEACASGCLPVITDIDSLGHIYGGAAPMVPFGGIQFAKEENGKFVEGKGPNVINAWHKRMALEFTDLVVRGLTDEAWRAENVAKCKALAAAHAWSVLADRLETILTDGIAKRSPAVIDSNGGHEIVVNGGSIPKNRKERRAAAAEAARSAR